jgi:hypothetical protein
MRSRAKNARFLVSYMTLANSPPNSRPDLGQGVPTFAAQTGSWLSTGLPRPPPNAGPRLWHSGARPRPSRWILARLKGVRQRRHSCYRARASRRVRSSSRIYKTRRRISSCSSPARRSASPVCPGVLRGAVKAEYAIDAIHCPPRNPRRWHGQERRRARQVDKHIRCRRHPLHRRAE